MSTTCHAQTHTHTHTHTPHRAIVAALKTAHTAVGWYYKRTQVSVAMFWWCEEQLDVVWT